LFLLKWKQVYGVTIIFFDELVTVFFSTDKASTADIVLEIYV